MGILESIQQQLEAVLAQNATLQQQVQQLWSLHEEWINAKQAAKFTGVHPATLVRERVKTNTVIRHKKQGNKDLYELKSLIAYNNKKAGRKAIDPIRVREQLRAN